MRVTFLAAAVPLTKSFNLDENGKLVKVGHPKIIDYTSLTSEIQTIEELAALLEAMAERNACFLKGNVSKPLVSESRAGSTNAKEPTRIAVLDLDGVKGLESVPAFMRAVGLSEVDHIVQLSASMGVDPSKGLSAHIFVLLDQEYTPSALKEWLIHLNLSIPELRSNLGLSTTGNAIKWPLDIGTCQNDKLIYIAPPLLGEGVVDTLKGPRIWLSKQRDRYATVPLSDIKAAANKTRMDEALAELRAARGLEKKKFTGTKVHESVEYLPNPDRAIITGHREERGFVYFNLNGGDSWAYYHPVGNPEFIYNFKGEPVYRTRELLPDYWSEIQRIDPKTATRLASDRVGMGIVEFDSGAYMKVLWDKKENTVTVGSAQGKAQLKDFLKELGQELEDPVKQWRFRFDPKMPAINPHEDLEKRWINLYVPSEYFKREPTEKPKPTPQIDRLINHALGNDQACYDHFMNWVACIAQFKQQNGTAWIMHGTQGTGKGLLLNRVLAPIFGRNYVVSKRMEELEDKFNGYMENCFVLFIDEAEIDKLQGAGKINASLKSYIVEPTISVRHMHAAAKQVTNHMNLIFATNMPNPVSIDPADRRFNVGTFQKERFLPTNEDLDQIDKELFDFYSRLMMYPADKDLARSTLNNSARKEMIYISRSSIDQCSDAILAGDLNFFVDLLPDMDTSKMPMTSMNSDLTVAYADLVHELVSTKPKFLTRDQMRILFEYCCGNMPVGPHKFTSLLKHHRILTTPTTVKGKQVRGIHVEWKE
jgi:hypothetical protein